MIGPLALGSCTVNEHDVYVAAESPAIVVRAVIEAALGATFSPSQDPQPVPVLATGTTMVFFHDSHPFEDDKDFPVSRYTYWVSVRDAARNPDRELAIARLVFDAVKARDWPAMLSFGTQGNIALHP